MSSRQTPEGENPLSAEADSIFLPGDVVKTLTDEDIEERSLRLVASPKTASPKSEHATEPETPRSRGDKARQRQQTFLHKRRKQKRRQVFYHRLRQMLKLCCVFFWVVVIWQFFSMPFWILDQPRLVLLNQQLIQANHIQPLITPLAGKPVFGVDPDQISNKLKEKFPLIDEIYVRRYLFPARVELFVLEKQPWAELYAPAPVKSAKIQTPDNTPPDPVSGKPLAVANTNITPAQPFGLLTTDYDIVPLARYRAHYHKDRYPAGSIQKVILPSQNFGPNKTFLKRLDRLTYKMSHAPGLHFEAMVVDSPASIRARYKETEILIGRLDASVFRRVDRLNALIPKIIEMKGELAAVDLRWGEQVTFKKK